MASATTLPVLPSSQPPDVCPPTSLTTTVILTKSGKVKHAENMTDDELVRHVESKLRPVGRELRSLVPFLREARDRFARPGRRVPVPGQPSYSEWIHQNIGVSDRHIRRLLAEAREPADRSVEDETAAKSKQEKSDEVLWQARRLAHSVLGLEEPDERDPSGVLRRATLAAMAYQFLYVVHRKPTAIIVRTKPLQPADVRGLYRVILACFETQLDEVFKSLADDDRREALSLFTHQIAGRYNGVKAEATLGGGESR
jgi:hypothetical protein